MGYKHSPETRLKISRAHKGRVSPTKGMKFSEESIRKRVDKVRGRKMSETARKNMSEAQKRRPPRKKGGFKHSEESKEKMRQKKLGKKMPLRSQEYRDAVSKRHKGKVLSEETRKKMSEARMGKPSARKGVKLSDETKEKLRQANLGKKYSEEVRRKVSEAGKGRLAWNKGKKYKAPKQSLAIKGSKNPNWKGGKSFEKYPQEWNDELRDTIRKRDNYLCSLCGISQNELIGMHKRLSVHHIDYNKRNLCHGNLISLCVKCHGKTHYNREHWEKYFKDKIEIKTWI